MSEPSSMKVGDWVEVRPITEILATLDERGCLEAMPFMPEMTAFCGARFQIFKSAHKTCDPTGVTDLRRINDAVHGEARCDGAAHGGCEAKCLIFWKKAWLKPADGPGGPAPAPAPEAAGLGLLLQNATAPAVGEDVRYRCQATEIGRASTPLSAASVDQYLEDVATGNVSAPSVAYHVFTAAAGGALSKLFRPLMRRKSDPRPRPAPPAPLGLVPGDIVEVRSPPEILATLKDGKNRGLVFEKEMMKFSGGRYRVLDRVTRIVDEKSGRMIQLKNDCVILEGLYCNGLNMRKRLFCPRAPYYYWREAWLRRVSEVAQAEEKAA